MPNHGLHRLPPPALLPPSGPEASPLPGPGSGSLTLAMPPVPAVHEYLIHRPPRPASHRIQSGLPRWSVIRIPRPRHPAQEEVAAVGGWTCSPGPRIRTAGGPALADTLDFRGLPAGPRVPALRLRRPYPPGHRPFVRKRRLPIGAPRGVSFPVPDPPAQVGPQTLDRTVHTAPLPGRGNPVRPPPRLRPLAGVALAPLPLIPRAPFHPPHPGTVPPLAIGRKGHRLVRHGRIDRHPPPRPRLPGAARKTGIDRRWQDPLGPGRPDARATPRPAARVDRRMGRAIVLAAKGLPVRILPPTGDHRLVREWVHRLERLPPDHPTRGLAGTTAVGAVPHTEGLVASGPVPGPGQANPRMAPIQPVF